MVRKAIRYIDKHIEEYLLTALLIALTIAMLLQVIMRYSFNAALSWPEEFCRYCFVYFSFLTLGYCVKNDNVLRLDAIKKIIPFKLWSVLSLITQFVCLAFYFYFFVYSIELVALVRNTSRTSPAMGIPFCFIYVAAVVGFALATIRTIQSLYDSFFLKSSTEQKVLDK